MLRINDHPEFIKLKKAHAEISTDERVLKKTIRDLSKELSEYKSFYNKAVRKRRELDYEIRQFPIRLRQKEYRERAKEPVMFDICEPDT